MDILRESEEVTAETLIGSQKKDKKALSVPGIPGPSSPIPERKDFWAIRPGGQYKEGGTLQDVADDSQNFVWDGSQPLQIQLNNNQQIRSLWIPAATASNGVNVFAGGGQGIAICSTLQTGPVISIPPGHTILTLVAATPFTQPCLVTAKGGEASPSASNVNANVSGNVNIGSMPAVQVAPNQAIGSPSDYPMGATPFSKQTFAAIKASLTTLISLSSIIPGQNVYITMIDLNGLDEQMVEFTIIASSAGAQEIIGIGDTLVQYTKPFNFGQATSAPVQIVIFSSLQGIATTPNFTPCNMSAMIQGYYL